MKRYFYMLVEASEQIKLDPYYYPRTQAERIAKEYNKNMRKEYRRPGMKATIKKVIETTADGQHIAPTI